MSKLNINKIGIVSRDYRNREKNGQRDFSYAFKSILTTLDEQACDSVLFSLYTINKRTSFNVENILQGLNIKNIRTVFLEEFKDDEERIPIGYVIYYQDKDQWREQRLTQKFAKSNKVNEKKKNNKGVYVLTTRALKKVQSFKKEVKEKRLFGNFTVLLCGETNIVNYKMATKKIEDQHKFSKILDKDIKVILNPIHDRMTRFEMKLKRKYLSKQKRWVVSIWNRGKSDKNGKVNMNHKNPHGWDIYYDGMEKELKPINHNVDNQGDIQIAIVNLYS